MARLISRVAFFALSPAPLGLSACISVKGAGRAIKSIGGAIGDATGNAQE